MERGTQQAIPWQGLVTSNGHHKRGGHPLLDKIYSETVSHLNDPVAVCNRIRSCPDYATLPGYYNILYQSFMPNCKLSVEVLKRYYRVTHQALSFILSGRNMRTCNQRILTFILTEFEKNYDILRFCVVVEQLIQLPELRRIADKFRNDFPIKPKENIQPVVDSEDTSEASDEKKVEFGAEDLHSSSFIDEIVDPVVKEVGASRVQTLIILKNRNRSSLVDHYPLVSEVTDYGSVVHENTDDWLQSAVTSQSVVDGSNPPSLDAATTPRLDNSRYTLDSLTQDTSHLSPYSTPSNLTMFDGLSEQVKSKPMPTKPTPVEYSRSHSSEASSPARSLSSLSPTKDRHHSLTSYGDSLHPASPLSDGRPLLESASPGAVGREMTVTLQPSMPPTESAAAAAASFSNVTPAALLESKGFEPLKSRYSLLYQSFPEDFMTTVNKLERHLTDKDIAGILSSTNAVLANKMILDSLIMRMKCKEDLLDLCDQLEKINGSPNINSVIHDLRNDVVKNIQKETTVQSYDHSKRANDPEPAVFSEVTLIDRNSKVMEVLKRYYVTLCHSLPTDYTKCATVLHAYGFCHLPAFNNLKTCSCPQKRKQLVVDSLIKMLDCEERLLDFCDIIDAMVQDAEFKHNIESFRNEILAVLSSKPQGSTEWRYPRRKQKVMLMQVQSGGHINQLSEDFTGSSTAIDTVPAKNISEPPSIPQYYVKRPVLEKQLTNAVLHSGESEAGLAAVTVTINGDSGFGKSTLAKAFCHSEDAKRYFTNGFILIELGPSVPNPLSKLKRLYRLLSHGLQITGDINAIVQYLHSLVVQKYPKILVIIDDICNTHDAQPYVMAFRSCKIIVTTRLDNISKQLSSCKVVTVGPMEPSEATKLLSSIPVQIVEDDETIVHELVNDLYLWPLLICLARGQFQVSQNKIQSIGDLQNQLYDKGLEHIAYNVDKNVEQGRKVAVTACIEASLELLEVDEQDCLVSLVHQAGVGAVISFHHVIHYWNLEEENCVQLLTKLDSMGLVMFTHAAAGNTKATVKVHVIVSQYLMDSQVYNPPAHLEDPQDGLVSEEQGQQMTILLLSHGSGDGGHGSTSEKVETPEICLINAIHHINNQLIPWYFVTGVMSRAAYWAAHILSLVEHLYSVVSYSPDKFPNYASLLSTADKISVECQSAMMEYKEEINKVNENVKAFVKDRKYDRAREVAEQYFINFSFKKLGMQAKDLTDQVVLHCDQKYKEKIITFSEFLYCFTPEYDFGLNLYLPQILLCIQSHQRYTTALESNPSIMEEAAKEVWLGKVTEQSGLINANYMIKLQEVAPHYVSELASGHGTYLNAFTHAYTSSEV